MLNLKDFFFFTRRERQGIVFLSVCIAIGIGAGLWMESRERRGRKTEEASAQRADSLWQELERNRKGERAEGWRTENRKREGREGEREAEAAGRLTPFAFDPNRADSATLHRLGLPGWMARNVVRYRQRGGRFRRAEDFKRIYGMTEEMYRILAPYIVIPESMAENDRTAQQRQTADTPEASGEERDTTPLYTPPQQEWERVEKYPAGTVVELNSCDTTELKRIPGIGSGIARRITAYRQQLGGFYDIRQLREISLDAERLAPWFSIDTTALRPIRLNRASVEQLRRHPYINFYQARAIVEYRRQFGRLDNLRILSPLEEFTREDLERIGHYASFE